MICVHLYIHLIIDAQIVFYFIADLFTKEARED